MAIVDEGASGTARRWWHHSNWRHWRIWRWRLWHLSRWSLGAFTLGPTTLVGMAGGVICWLLWRNFSVGLVGAERSATLFDLARSTVTLLGVVTIGGAAAVAFRRQKTLEQQHQVDVARSDIEAERAELERDKEVRAERTDLHVRYQEAAAQLGHEEAIIRIAGVYALEALATEWGQLNNTVQRSACIDLLCGYLRSTRGITWDDDLPHMREDERDVRSTVATVIARHLHDGDKPGDWSGHAYDFNSAHFYQADFYRAQFENAVVLKGAIFHTSAMFLNARFYSTVMVFEANFNGDVEFSGVRFDETAIFDGTSFRGGARFASAQFRDYACFDRAEFGAPSTFFRAHFSNIAHVRYIHFHAEVSFDSAHFPGGIELSGCRDSCHVAPNLRDVLVAPGKLTPRLKELGARELPSDTDCDKCEEASRLEYIWKW